MLNVEYRGGDILVVDDSPTSRSLLGGILERRGYRVRFAQDGEEALESVRAAPPDLILLDLILPRLDGFKVTRRLRTDPSLPYIPIILVTTLGDQDSKVKALEVGADDYVVKPPDEDELLGRVGALLRLKRSQEALLVEKRKTDLLYEVGRALSGELDLDTLLAQILHLTTEALGAHRGSIILLDEQGGVGRRISYQDGVVPIAKEVWDTIIREGLAGWVIRYQMGSIVLDTEDDPRWAIVQGAHRETRSALAVPLVQGGQVIGILTLTHNERGYFVPDHLDLLNSIASQAAVTIEKARAYLKEQLRARQLQLVNEVGRQATSILDPNQLLREVSRLVCQTFDHYYVEIGLTEGDELIFQDWSCGRNQDLYPSPERLSLDSEAIVTWVARERKPLLVPDVSQEPRYRATSDLPDTVAEIAVPLQVGGEVLGVLDVQSDWYGRLTEADVPLLETLASQVAVALKNARLFQESQRRITEQAILNEIGRALSSALELNALVEVIYQQVSRLFDATNFYIAAYDEDPDEWETLLHVEEGNRVPLARYQVGAGLTGHIIRNKVALLFSSQLELEAFERAEGVDPVGRLACSWLGVPLIVANHVVGVMGIQNYEQEHLYGEQDQALFSTIASQAASVIQNARLYMETEQERGKLAAVLASTTDVVVVTDHAGRVLLFNPAAERAFGIRFENAVNRPMEGVIPNQELIELFQRSVQEIPPNVAEVRLSGEHTLYASLSRVQGVGYVAVMQDISHLKRLDFMKNEFVSTVSHDLRSPLNAIRGYAELLQEMLEDKKAEEARDIVLRIQLRAEQMAELIEDLLSLGRIEAGVEVARVACQLEQLLTEAVEAAMLQAQTREISLTAEVPVELPPVTGDPAQLRRVLDNLLSNALKYTPAGGAVVVRARQETDQVLAEVQDTGIGIPRDARPRLFEKFYRVASPETDSIPGSGLGLAIVKAIVEQHHGQVWIESEVGQGSTFGFSLPVSREHEHVPQ